MSYSFWQLNNALLLYNKKFKINFKRKLQILQALFSKENNYFQTKHIFLYINRGFICIQLTIHFAYNESR